MQRLKVDKVYIGRQFEDNDNYNKFAEIVETKKIKVSIIEAGQKIRFSKSTYMNVLWPDKDEKITANSINNNALVFKICYKEKSILFTGDIEEKAERALIKKYKETEELNATILKVAHHGSKSSSIEEFLKLVSPEISIIGVGAENTFGHPSDQVLERIENLKSKIYRTDLNAEITIRIDKQGKIITEMMNYI